MPAGVKPPTPDFLAVLDFAVETQKDKQKDKSKKIAQFDFIRHSEAPATVEVRVICDVTLPRDVSEEVEKIVMVPGSIPQKDIDKAHKLVDDRLPENTASDFKKALKAGFQNQRDKS